MKKLLGAHTVLCNSFKGRIIAEMYSYSSANEVLGKFLVGKCNGRKRGIFVKYVPEDGADCERDISTFKVSSEEPENAKVFLEEARKKIEEERDKNPSKYMIYSGIITAICPESNAIFIPFGFVSITNNFITKYIADHWVRIEALFSKEVLELYEQTNK